MEEEPVCHFLEWDTNFFGCRIARVIGNDLDCSKVAQINRWCDAEQIDCLYFLANMDKGKTIRLAEDNGFRLVDLRVTLEKQISCNPVIERGTTPIVIRLCTQDDLNALRAIARVNYSDTRFYFDQNFPRSLCDALYEIWIEKSCKGYANAVLVAEFQKVPVGFITCNKIGEKDGEIGLVGVSVERQGMGLGSELLFASLGWFYDRGVTNIKVVTQGRNSKAQRLYQRCGFVTRTTQIWYHRWFSQPYR